MSESFRPNHYSILYPFPLSLETERGSVRILSLRSGVIHGFCDRALTLLLCPVFMWVRSFKCALSRLVSCWSVVFGSRHSCLEFQFRIGVQTLALHVLSRFGSMQSRVRSAACSSVHVCCCMQFVFYRLRAFMLCLVVCGTQLVFLMGCVLSCCHVLNEHVAYEYSY